MFKECVMQHLKKNGKEGEPIYVIGNSFGGLKTLNYLHMFDHDIKAVILTAPFIRTKTNSLYQYYWLLKVGSYLHPNFIISRGADDPDPLDYKPVLPHTCCIFYEE
mmetsp:Transcript_43022/g.31410  ORF Transcript_43022/g.31410 Transcript_43022/m.31410 type:complete len:106 (-) Transcript_43022:249-566(-)